MHYSHIVCDSFRVSSDPYVKIMVGEHKFDVNKKRGLLSMFGGGDTFLLAETSKVSVCMCACMLT